MPRKATGTAEAPDTAKPEGLPEGVSYDFESVQAMLKEPVDPDLIRVRDAGFGKVEYIEWHTACDILDRACPEWEHTIKTVQIDGNFIFCIVALTVAGVTREGLGCGDAQRGETGFKKAESDALKRAATKFGIARDLYHKESYDDTGNNGGGQPYSGGGQKQFDNSKPVDPFYRVGTQGDTGFAPSDGQEKAMYAISKALGYDQTAFAAQLFTGCTDVKQLNKKAASYMIEQLKLIQTQGQAVAPQPSAPPMPAAPQPASTEQGQLADINTINSLKILCNNKKQDLGTVVMNFTAGRTNDPAQMSQAECVAAHDAVAAMP